jgi:hypothetical protein
MANRKAIAALSVVIALLVIGVIGWVYDIAFLQVAFIVLSVVIIGIVGTIFQIRIFGGLANKIYNKKEFERLTRSGGPRSYRDHLIHLFGLGSVMFMSGLGFLWLYMVSGSITALLWGGGFALSGASSLIQGCIFREKKISAADEKRAMNFLEFVRWLFMLTPAIAIVGTFLLRNSTILGGDLAMMNVFGLLVVTTGLIIFPATLWKAAAFLLHRHES